ncbi:nuclease-related domain-containing protein [Desulfobacula sp.]|uniref:nuclease-related domain-containing protein n=1 Tax=Desulfobacula sp. TaxID=2593537 RepID=UPI0027149DBA|nr:nuclease-related domain-containing protein [Desulfobacula sp.]
MMMYVFVAIGVIVILGSILQSTWFKGWFGEFQINLASRFFLDKNYHVVNNVTFPTKDGSTQVDHIIISPFGVFVVETKNMRGWIFGRERDKYWTQKLHKNHSQKFQNPLHQNYKHTKILTELLGLPETKVKSLIAFVGDFTFKTTMPENVTKGFGYLRYLKGHNQRILTEVENENIIKTIAQNRLSPGLKTHKAHVKHINRIIARKQTKKSHTTFEIRQDDDSNK